MSLANEVRLHGNLGADPEMRYTQSGLAICNFNLATTEWKKGKDGKGEERTEWHRLVAFGRTAENCGEYLAKGSPVHILGHLQTRKWQDKAGNDRYTTEVVVDEIKFLGQAQGGGKQGGRQSNQGRSNNRGQRQSQGRSQGGGRQQRRSQPPPPDDNYDYEDDIPF